jgi:pimeloyl-ACP methyl ester carboxylesterase
MSVQKSTIDRLIPLRPMPRGATRALTARLTRAGRPARRRPTGPVPTSRALRTTFRVLEHQPVVGGWLGERLWFHLPPRPLAQVRADRTPAGGEPFEVAWAGGTIRGRVYGDWGLPTAYLVHGWGGWWQQLSAHVQPLLDRGMCVVAFDAPSHGDSAPGRFGSRSTTFVEMSEGLGAVVRDFGRPSLVLAHSAGAMAALLALDAGTVRPEALALIAPPTSVPPMMDFFADAAGVGERSQRAMAARAERRVGHPMESLDLVTLASRQADLPRLLVAHDRNDREAPLAGSVALTTAWHDSRLLVTDGLGHRRILRDPAVVRRVADLGADAAGSVRRSSR